MVKDIKRLSRGDCMLIAMGILLIAAILYIAFTFGGSPRAISTAGDKIWAYIDENYPDINFNEYGKQPEHLGSFSYSLLVSSSDCEDIYFYVSNTEGNISDDYYYRVVEMSNTLLRLEKEMGEYFGSLLIASDTDVIRCEMTFPPRVRNDIPDSIYHGVEFDPSHPIYRGSTLTIVCSATDDMSAVSSIIEKAHTIALENGILFSDYTVYGLESPDAYSLEISGVDPEAIESGGLSDILHSALTGILTVSESDIEGISAELY